MLRCEELELLDAKEVPDRAVAEAYRELGTLHLFLGNTAAVMRLLRQGDPTPHRVLDIGCGQGALLERIRKELGADVVGMDLRPAPADAPVPIIGGNAVTEPLPRADIAISLMTAHHLSEAELAALIGNVARSCRRFILLDPVRHPVPLALFRIFVAPWLGPINRQDGQTSVCRSYTTEEMRRIVDQALSSAGRPVRWVRHTVGPLWIRQMVDIRWDSI